MRTAVVLILFCFSTVGLWAQEGSVESRVISTDAQDLILVQQLEIEAPVAAVWAAYTTSEGWMAWAAPAAEIDLRSGGTIRTNYNPGARVGDEGTNTLHILNYVPERVLTLQAELDQSWPEMMKEDASNLMNVIVFESLDANTTRIHSYGVGYRDTEAYQELMQFFIPANEGLLEVLKVYLEG